LQLAPVDPRMALAQALPGGQQAALAVGFDGTTFQSKINGLPCTIREDSNRVQAFDEQVVLAGIELPAPAGKAEVEQAEVLAFAQGDRSAVAQPGVVVGDFDEAHTLHVDPRRGRSEEHTSELQSRENLVCRLLL